MKSNRRAESFIVTKKSKENGSHEYHLLEHGILDRYQEANKSKNNIQYKSKQIDWDNPFYQQFKKPAYNLKQLCSLLEQNTFHKDCCEVVAEDASAYSWNIIPTADVNEEPPVEEKKLLVDWINNFTTPINTTFFEANYDMRSMGSGALEYIRESDPESNIIDIKKMRIFQTFKHNDNCRVMQEHFNKRKWFILYGTNYDKKGNKFDVHCDTGMKYPYGTLSEEERANEIVWLRQYAPHMDNYGLAKIVPAIRAIYGDIGRSEYNNKFFENYGMPSFALTVTGDFQDYDEPETLENGEPNPDYDVTQTLKYKISQQLEQVIENPHSAVTILVPSVGDEGNVNVSLQPLSVQSHEASFRMFRSDNKEEVLAAHRVPPYRLGISAVGQLGTNVSSETSDIYSKSTVQPLRKLNEEIINNLIRNEFGINKWEFKLVQFDSKDVNQELANAEILFKMGALTPFEIIETFGKPYGAIAPPDDPLLHKRFIGNVPMEKLFEAETPTGQEVNEFIDKKPHESHQLSNLFQNLRRKKEETKSEAEQHKIIFKHD